MKKLIFISWIFMAMSCVKNADSGKISTPDQQDFNLKKSGSSLQSSTALKGNTKFGCIINGNFTTDQSITVAKSLNIPYVRIAIIMNQWKGKSSYYESWVNNGIQPVLNVNYQQQTNKPYPFPTDLTSYRQTFTDIVNKYQPEVIVVENEEINQSYHTGPLSDYVNMLKVALDVCHAKGIKVTNGGIYGSPLEVLVYRYLQTKGQSRADSFAANCMTTWQIKAAQEPGRSADLESQISRLDTLLNFYNNLDYVNIHPYESLDPNIDPSTADSITPLVIADMQEYLIARTGKQVMTNETGQRNNTNPDLVTSMLSEYDRLSFPYAIWYSGYGGAGAEPLYDVNTGALYSNGTAFSNYMASY